MSAPGYLADHEAVKVFATPQGAYMWAVEALSRPGVQSPDGKRLARSSGDGPSRDDIEAEAMSVLQCVNRIQNTHDRAAFKYVFTDRYLGSSAGVEQEKGFSEEDTASLASTVAGQVSRKHTEVPYGRISSIAKVAVKAVREKYRGTMRKDGHTEYPQELYAFVAGLGSRQSLRKGPWQLIIADCEREFRAAVKRGKKAAAEELRGLGVLDDKR